MSKSNLILASLIAEYGAITPRVSKEIVALIDKKYVIRLDEREADAVPAEETTESVKEYASNLAANISTDSVLSPETQVTITAAEAEQLDHQSHADDEAQFAAERKDLDDADAAAGHDPELSHDAEHVDEYVTERSSQSFEAGQVTNDTL